MLGEVHSKPCGYNCPCNIGRTVWVECESCLERRVGPLQCQRPAACVALSRGCDCPALPLVEKR
jgi:hypothetical protein